MGYPYKKIDIEGVGCFTVPKPVWDLLQDIDTTRDAVTAERNALREEVALLRARIDDLREELFEIERDE